MSSLIYKYRTAYHLLMRLLYGHHFDARYRAIATKVPPGATVLDVCAGDGYLYLSHLRNRHVTYLALDIAPELVQWMKRHGIDARRFDVWRDTLPAADVVIMQASLYQFLPNAAPVIERLLCAARQSVIIAEPVRNMSSSSNPLLRVLSRRMTRPAGNGTYAADRFNLESLLALFRRFPAFEASWLLPGGREMIGIFRGQKTA
jgi:hypothetical protein